MIQTLTNPANLQALALQIRNHIHNDVLDARVRALGASIVRKYRVPARQPFALARAVLLSAQKIKFFREYPEINAAPWITAQWGIGDCDDKARYIAAILLQFRIPVRLAFVSFRKGLKGNFMAHVWPEAKVGPQGSWVAMESVRPWPMGKSALDAIRRKKWPYKVFRVAI